MSDSPPVLCDAAKKQRTEARNALAKSKQLL